MENFLWASFHGISRENDDFHGSSIHSFFVRTVPEWNSLPEACVNADTVTAFQAQLRHTP